MIRIGDRIHTIDEYIQLLSTSLKIYMDRKRLLQAYEDLCFHTDDLRALAVLWMKIESSGRFSSIDRDSMIDFLIEIGVDMDGRYANRKTGSYSLDQKKVIAPLIERGIVPEFLKTYSEYTTHKSYCSALRSLVEKSHVVSTTVEGRLLSEFPTNVQEKDNLRVYYNNISVVSVPKAYSNMITCPRDDQFIAWCDFPQADFRLAYNMFLRDDGPYDAIFSETKDAYQALAQIVERDSFNEELFRESRPEYKRNSLKVYYNSRDNAPIPTALREFYNSRPKYQKQMYDLGLLYHFKLPIPCTSYFGYEQLIPEGAYPDAFISKGLNTPIQTLTSHLVIETVFAVLEKFWSLGYTKEDVNVYYVRHDEPLFICSRKVLKDAWVFKECSEISIAGFTPMHLDFHFGMYYTEEDANLTSLINSYIDSSNHVYEDFDRGEAQDYSPFPSVESMYMRFVSNEHGLLVQCYDYRHDTMFDYQTFTMDMDAALHDALLGDDERKGAIEWIGSPRYLLIRNNNLDFMDHLARGEGTLIKVVARYDPNIDRLYDEGVS